MDGAHEGYPPTSFDLTVTARRLRQFDLASYPTGGNAGKPASSNTVQVTYDWTSSMLNAAAEALAALKGSVKVEFICAELFSELQLMRNGEDHHRPKEFPRSFLRVWMTNIP